MIKKLLNLKLKFTKNQKGLTLIELLVVIVILGIIAAIAIPAVMGQSEKAQKNADAQTLSVIQDALKRYQAVEGDPTASDTTSILVPEYVDSVPSKCTDGTKDAKYTITRVDNTKPFKGGNITVTSVCPE